MTLHLLSPEDHDTLVILQARESANLTPSPTHELSQPADPPWDASLTWADVTEAAAEADYSWDVFG
jgi:hypothetical protein